MAGGSIYIAMFVSCGVLLMLTLGIGAVLYAFGRSQEKRERKASLGREPEPPQGPSGP